MGHIAASPVAAAVYTALNVSSLTTLAPGGVHDVLPQVATYPCVAFSVEEVAQLGGFGTMGASASGLLPEVLIRVYALSTAQGMKECHQILSQAAALLKAGLSVTGYTSPVLFHDQTRDVGPSEIAGKRVNEMVADFRLYVQAT